ncbi:MAG TPA: ATP-binding protein [Armatimonadota bacterium]|nr:ATP-binding protein [Armatimonadota bacterium]
MALQFEIGLDAVASYKRLAYTPWHAIAEFVDNSTQAYFDNREVLDDAFKKEGKGLEVGIVYDSADGFLRISDNSIGMSYQEMEYAMHVARPPKNTSGRSKYGMGMKTAACWIGNHWTVKTKRLGETVEHNVTIDVARIAAGHGQIPYKPVQGKRLDDHYTIIEITDHNRRFEGRTLGKIKDFLRSMYREDFRNSALRLEWQGASLTWAEPQLLRARDGSIYRKGFAFSVDGKQVGGWVGILAKGGRPNAGFSIIHCGRVVHGWPDSWRPSSLYGQLQGSNDLINQRLVGEIHLDEFDVSHTKDDILWLGNQEEAVERNLREHCGDYRDIARDYRKPDDEERGPSEVEISVAVDELKQELESAEMVDAISLETIPPEKIVEESMRKLMAMITSRPETFSALVGRLAVQGYLVGDLSPNDPYIVLDSTGLDRVVIVVNTAHPHWSQLKGSDGVLNYLRHCTYDAIAEWQARHKAGRLDPDTIKLLKDKLLRIPFELEMSTNHEGEPEDLSIV